MSDGGGEDPNKFKYMRRIAFRCLNAMFIFNTALSVAIYLDQSLSEPFQYVFIGVNGFFSAIVFHYMGVSNKWGIK